MRNNHHLNDEELLMKFRRAAVEAGISGSGLVISFSGEEESRQAIRLHGLVLARIRGQKPPFMPGDRVRATSSAQSENHDGASLFHHRQLGEGIIITINEIWYLEYYDTTSYPVEKKWGWQIEHRDAKKFDWLFLASHFELAPAEEAAPAV